jgi:hypothetical protein
MTIKSQILKLNNGHEPTTFNEVAECIMNSIRYNIRGTNALLGFAWNVEYRDHNVHHTHEKHMYDSTDHCMYGRVWIRLEARKKGWSSDLFNNTLSYTGTGGIGSYNGPWTHLYNQKEKEIICYSYGFSFMLKDWPNLDAEINKRITFNTLKSHYKEKVNHQFTWTDPDVRITDEELLAAFSS